MKIPAGGTAEVRVKTPASAFTNNFQLELNEPPDGISIASVSQGRGNKNRVAQRRRQDQAGRERKPDRQRHGQKAAARRGRGKGAENQRAWPGTLPAIPFEIVLPDPSKGQIQALNRNRTTNCRQNWPETHY